MLQKILREVVTATRLYSLSMVGTPLLLPDALSASLPVKPFLAKAPENVSTDAGSTARFSCAVDGVPKPKVFFSSLDNLSFFFISYLTSVQQSSSLPFLPGGLGQGREQTQPWQDRSRGRSSFEDPRSNIERCWGISVCCGEYCWGH